MMSTLLDILFFLYYFLAVLGLSCCERGSSPVTVRWRLTAVVSLVVEHGLQSVQAQQSWHRGLVAHNTCNLSGPAIKPEPSVLAGGYLTARPPGNSYYVYFFYLDHFRSHIHPPLASQIKKHNIFYSIY